MHTFWCKKSDQAMGFGSIARSLFAFWPALHLVEFDAMEMDMPNFAGHRTVRMQQRYEAIRMAAKRG
jgi:hypothetical protein